MAMAMDTLLWKCSDPPQVLPPRHQRPAQRCRQVLDSSPPALLPPGEFVIFFNWSGESSAKNLEGEFLATIEHENPPVEQPPLKKQRNDPSSPQTPKTLLIEEMRRDMALFQSQLSEVNSRLSTVEVENKELKENLSRVNERLMLYCSTGTSLVSAATSLIEYAADQISFKQRKVTGAALLKHLELSRRKNTRSLVKDVNIEFTTYWPTGGFVEDIRYNQYLKRTDKGMSEKKAAEDALQEFATEMNVSVEALTRLMEWYVLDYRMVRNREVHVFGLFKDPAYEKLKPEEEQKSQYRGAEKQCRARPESEKDMKMRLMAVLEQPEYEKFTIDDLMLKEKVLVDLKNHMSQLPDCFRDHETVIDSLASHVRKELNQIRSQLSGHRYRA